MPWINTTPRACGLISRQLSSKRVQGPAQALLFTCTSCQFTWNGFRTRCRYVRRHRVETLLPGHKKSSLMRMVRSEEMNLRGKKPRYDVGERVNCRPVKNAQDSAFYINLLWLEQRSYITTLKKIKRQCLVWQHFVLKCINSLEFILWSKM